MAGRLKRIVDYVEEKVILKNLAIARMNIVLGRGINVNDFSDETPDNPEMEQKLIDAAKIILGVQDLDIS
jgi:hypothetical protein